MSDAGPQSIASLADGFDISRQAISKHLRVMNDAGLARSAGGVVVKQYGNWSRTVLPRRDSSCRSISKDWDDKLRRLKVLVESEA